MRIRAFPHVGDTVTVTFLAATVGGIIETVESDLRRLRVVTDEGEQLTFVLNRGIGRFVAEGQSGARLSFGPAGERQ